MSESQPTNPESISMAEKEAKGIALAKEFRILEKNAKTDDDNQLAIEKLRELQQLFSPSKAETKLSGEIQEQIKQAKEILGNDCLGFEELKNAFGIELNNDQIPPIPFSRDELMRAKELGQFLVLRVDKFSNGEPFTIKEMNSVLEGKTKDGGKILYNDDGTGTIKDDAWYKDEDYFTKYTPKLSWALTTKEVIPNSKDKNYFEQTQILSDYIKNQVFKDQELPQIYQEAVDEFNQYYTKEFTGKSQKKINTLLNGSNWQKYSQELSQLKIQQFRLNEFSDLVNYAQNNNQRLLKDTYIWSSVRGSSGRLVIFGYFDADGAYVIARSPGNRSDRLGVSFSRCL